MTSEVNRNRTSLIKILKNVTFRGIYESSFTNVDNYRWSLVLTEVLVRYRETIMSDGERFLNPSKLQDLERTVFLL